MDSLFSYPAPIYEFSFKVGLGRESDKMESVGNRGDYPTAEQISESKSSFVLVFLWVYIRTFVSRVASYRILFVAYPVYSLCCLICNLVTRVSDPKIHFCSIQVCACTHKVVTFRNHTHNRETLTIDREKLRHPSSLKLSGGPRDSMPRNPSHSSQSHPISCLCPTYHRP